MIKISNEIGENKMYPQYNQTMYGQQVVRVTGENGARAFQMQPNSSALLLDSDDPILYLKTTDGAGYPTITMFKIEKYVPEPDPIIKGKRYTLLHRIWKISGIKTIKNTWNVSQW